MYKCIFPGQHVKEARNVNEANNVKWAFGTYLAYQEVQFTIYFLCINYQVLVQGALLKKYFPINE